MTNKIEIPPNKETSAADEPRVKFRRSVGEIAAKPERREIYNSAKNFFSYWVPKGKISGDGRLKFDIAGFPEFDFDGIYNAEIYEDFSGQLIGEESALFVVADGMGGYYMGDAASKLTVQAFLGEGLTEMFEDGLEDAVAIAEHKMERRISAARNSVAELNGAGSTVVAAEIIGDKLVYSSVGDNSVFVVRDGKFILVAGDRGGHGNVINNYIGGELPAELRLMPQLSKSNFDVDHLSRQERQGDCEAKSELLEISKYDHIGTFQLSDGDRVVLCSDGIMGDWSLAQNGRGYASFNEQTLTDEEIVEALSMEKSPEGVAKAVENLMRLAKKQDDRTVQMFDIELQ